MRSSNCGHRALVVLGTCLPILVLAGCKTSTAKSETKPAEIKTTVKKDDLGDLQAAMDKLQESLDKPAAPFHVSLKKESQGGSTTQCEADISADGIVGKMTDFTPVTKFGTDTFPARTSVHELKGTPKGSPEWGYARGNIIGAYLNGHIGDAQEGVKYVGDEQSGGYEARHYDFDLANVDATIKKAMNLGNAMPGMRQTKDFSMKGSAWIAKDDGRMVKFEYDTIYTFADGSTDTTHYEGAVTKK